MASSFLTQSAPRRKANAVQADAQGAHMLHRSDRMVASVVTAGSVHINVSINADPVEVGKWLLASGATTSAAVDGMKKSPDNKPSNVRETMKAALVALFSNVLSKEVDKVVDAYRIMLRESLAKGNNIELQTALNRARLQEKILAGTSMADQAQACALLGLSGANPSATMKRKEDKREVLRFTVDGRAAYPVFQFDVDGRRVLPGMAKLIALKPDTWSDFRLLHWLTRPHLDFGGAPSAFLGPQEAEVVAAFERETALAEHG